MQGRETEKKHPKGLEEIGKLSVRQLCFQALVQERGKRAWYIRGELEPSSLGNLHTTPLH